MQNKIKINNVEIYQPDSDNLSYNFETTYSSDSQRTQNGVGHFTPLFTVEQLGYSASNIPANKVAEILQLIAKGRKFNLFYYSTYYGTWRTAEFYVGKGSLTIGTLSADKEKISKLSFNMTGVNPI